MSRCAALAVIALACGPRTLPPGSPDQTIAQAVALLCDAPARARDDRAYKANPSDTLVKHLSDGLGNGRVLTVVEGWKTDGIQLRELDALMKEANITSCTLRREAR